MRSKLAFVCALIAALSFGCDQAVDEPEEEVAELQEGEYIVAGSVADAREGVQPDGGFPDEVGEPEEFGGIAVRPVNPGDADGLEDCETVQDAYVMYYTDETLFDPPDTDDGEGFPDSVEGMTVTAQGTIFEADAEADADVDADASPDADADESPDVLATGCVLVADRVEVEEQTEDTTDDGDPAVGGTDASPGATGSPEAGEEEEVAPGEEEFPEHEDTDPIFEGTPSPDPCEGQKACEEKREEGEIP